MIMIHDQHRQRSHCLLPWQLPVLLIPNTYLYRFPFSYRYMSSLTKVPPNVTAIFSCSWKELTYNCLDRRRSSSANRSSSRPRKLRLLPWRYECLLIFLCVNVVVEGFPRYLLLSGNLEQTVKHLNQRNLSGREGGKYACMNYKHKQ